MSREIRFHRAIYNEAALAAAASQFEAHAKIDLAHDDTHYVVRLEHADEAWLDRIEDELGNMVLGMTIERGGAGDPS